MPYLSNAEIENSLALRDNRGGRDDDDDEGSPIALAPMAGGMGAAALMGFVRSKFEDPATGQWNLPGTPWDAEAAAFIAATVLAFGGQYVGLGRFRTLAAIGAIGVGSHYLGEVARRFGKTGRLDWHVGSGIPPWDPTSFDPTQFANPHDDAQAAGLASSGV